MGDDGGGASLAAAAPAAPRAPPTPTPHRAPRTRRAPTRRRRRANPEARRSRCAETGRGRDDHGPDSDARRDGIVAGRDPKPTRRAATRRATTHRKTSAHQERREQTQPRRRTAVALPALPHLTPAHLERPVDDRRRGHARKLAVGALSLLILALASATLLAFTARVERRRVVR